MLTFYYHPASAFARPVWLMLLEKELSFEAIPVDLSGEQFNSEFQAINPFSQVPVLVTDSFRIVESLAIMDYLEAQYPSPSLSPSDPRELATVRMVQQITVNKILPILFKLLTHDVGSENHRYSLMQGHTALSFLSDLLPETGPYFAGEQLTIAEITAGSVLPRLSDAGLSLADYPRLADWADRLQTRPAWQAIALSQADWQRINRIMRVLPKLWERRRRQKLATV